MSVILEEKDGVAWLRMDDGKVNALSLAQLDALDRCLDEAHDAKIVVIAGRPGRFSAGFDIKFMMSGPEQARMLVKRGAEVLMKIYGLAQPVIAACTGHALAAGALLLLACDQRLGVSGDFKLGLNETSIGVTLPGFALALAEARLDPRRLCQATLQASIYTPAQAAEVGFLDRVVAPEALEQAVQQAALRLGALSLSAFANSKRDQRGATVARVLSEVDANLASILDV